MVHRSAINRRDFLKRTSVAAGIGALGVPVASAAAVQGGVALIIDPGDAVAASAPAGWAVQELRQALAARQIAVETVGSLDQARTAATRIRIAGIASPAAQDLLRRADLTITAASKSLALVPSSDADGAILLAAGNDARGLTYAVTELADRVRHGADPLAALRVARANRGAAGQQRTQHRALFESDVEDRSWFHDRAMLAYLAMLATQRFNRFSMTFGFQYNYPMEVSDVYLYFAYPVPAFGSGP